MPVKSISSTKLLLVLSPLLISPAAAVLRTGFNTTRPEWLYDGILPASLGISANCTRAYSSSIDCDESILMSPNLQQKASTLNRMCVKTCSASLLAYQKSVKEACAQEDIIGKSLERTWLNLLLRSGASLSMYYTQCIRDLTTSSLCQLTDADFVLAWDAASPSTATPEVVKAFCENSCLTQNVVINVPSRENLADLSRMCPNGIGLESFPFIENMKLAGILRGDEPIFALGKTEPENTMSEIQEDVPKPPRSAASQYFRSGWFIATSLAIAVGFCQL